MFLLVLPALARKALGRPHRFELPRSNDSV